MDARKRRQDSDEDVGHDNDDNLVDNEMMLAMKMKTISALTMMVINLQECAIPPPLLVGPPARSRAPKRPQTSSLVDDAIQADSGGSWPD